MSEIEVEELANESNLFIRSCRVKIGSDTIITPTITLGATKDSGSIPNAVKNEISSNFHPFGEVYTQLSISSIDQLINDDNLGHKFSTKISNQLCKFKEIGASPYLLLSITDDNGNPYPHLLPEKAQQFVFDILWGTIGNNIVVPPLSGVLPQSQDYIEFISRLKNRKEDAVDRRNLPIMGIIPASYNLIAPELLNFYWDMDVRFFGFNCENKKYAAYGYIVERMHSELNRLQKESDEGFIINAINSRYKIGKGESSRVNNLIGTGFGFDTYSPNHVTQKFIVHNDSSKRAQKILSPHDYGFFDIFNNENSKKFDAVAQNTSIGNFDISDLKSFSDYKVKKIAKEYDLQTVLKEIKNYGKQIESEKLMVYLNKKTKISNEMKVIRELKQQSGIVDEWFL